MNNHGIFLVSGMPDEAHVHAAVARAFAGWRVGRAVPGCPAQDIADFDADLIVIDGDWPLVAAIRALDHAVARVPIVAVATPTIDGVDDHVAAITQDALAALAERWTPEPLPALERLAAALGAAEIARLAIGLRDQLVAALRSLDEGEGEGDRALAHRVAGFAGMLGFTALGQEWNALSHGRRDHLPALRIATRRAIAALDRASPMPLV